MQDRGRLGRVEAFGKRVKPFDRCNDEFGERALATLIAEAVGSHSIARPEVLGCFPDGDEGTHEITADDERERHRSGKAPDRTKRSTWLTSLAFTEPNSPPAEMPWMMRAMPYLPGDERARLTR